MASRNYSLLLVTLILTLLLFFLDLTRRIDFLVFPLRRLLVPWQQASGATLEALVYPLGFINFIRSGEQRIKYLENKNLELTAQTQELDSLKRENEELSRQLGVSLSKTKVLAKASVLGFSRFLEFELVDGKVIKEGQVAIYADNILGVVIKTGSSVGFLRLISDPESKIAAKTKVATGIVVGEFSSGVVLEKVGKSEILNVGDIVTTSGTGGQTPPDLIIGRVKKILPSADELFQRAEIEPIVDIRKLRTIYIVVS